MGNENFPFGVGPSNFNRGLFDLKERGIYDKKLPDYDPHSSFTGTYAELGIFGFIAFVVFIFLIYSTLKTLPTNPEKWVFLSLFFFFLIETTSTDTLNFRHYWLAIAMLALMISNNSTSVK